MTTNRQELVYISSCSMIELIRILDMFKGAAEISQPKYRRGKYVAYIRLKP